MKSINDDILYGIDNSINNEKVKHRIKQEREKLDYEKQYYIKEIERLNNIINELEEELEYRISYGEDELEYEETETYRLMTLEDKIILEKLQELKGDGSNE